MAREIPIDHPLLTEEKPDAVLPATHSGRTAQNTLASLPWRQTAGGLAVLFGLIAVAAGWWGASGTTRTVDQLSYITSGCIGGLTLIALGVLLLVAQEHVRDREALATVVARLDTLEDGMTRQFEHLYGALGQDLAPVRALWDEQRKAR